MKKFLLSTLTVLALSASFALAGEPVSAFDAIKIADKELNKEAKDRVIEIFGEKSNTSVFPDKWQIIFFDPYAKQDGRMIEVTAGRVTAIQDGYTQLGKFRLAAYKPEEVINPGAMKIDSSKILDILKTSTALKDAHITGLRMKLVKPDKSSAIPNWYVVISASSSSTGESGEVGEATISAATGQILNLDIDSKKLK